MIDRLTRWYDMLVYVLLIRVAITYIGHVKQAGGFSTEEEKS